MAELEKDENGVPIIDPDDRYIYCRTDAADLENEMSNGIPVSTYMANESFTQSVDRFWTCNVTRVLEHALWNHFMVYFAISTNCDNSSAEWEEYYQKSNCWEGSKFFKPMFAIVVSGSIFLLALGAVLGYDLWKESLEASNGYFDWVNENSTTNF